MRNIIRDKEVRKRTGLSNTTRWRLQRAGSFPQSVRLTEGGSVGWYEDEIDAWVHDRVRAAGRRPASVGPAADTPRPRRSHDDDRPEPPPAAA